MRGTPDDDTPAVAEPDARAVPTDSQAGEPSEDSEPDDPSVMGPTPLSITSKTTFAAPDGSPDTRDVVGVGEEVTCTGSRAGTWVASGGMPFGPVTGRTLVWTANGVAASVSIQLTVGAVRALKTITVLEPKTIIGESVGDMRFPADLQGAGFRLRFTYHPMTVSFGNVFAKEVSGPASGI